MSFLRHKQIYQSDVRHLCQGWSRLRLRPRPHRLDESATGYSSTSCTPALLASASPAVCHGESGSRNCQPPPPEGWGIFSRNFGEFSTGVDTFILAVREGWSALDRRGIGPPPLALRAIFCWVPLPLHVVYWRHLFGSLGENSILHVIHAMQRKKWPRWQPTSAPSI